MMTNHTYVIDRDGYFVRVPLAPGQRADDVLKPGQRWPSAAEMTFEAELRERRRAHGAEADYRHDPVPVYRLAAELAARPSFVLTRADLDDLNAAVIGKHEPQVRRTRKRPIAGPAIACENRLEVDVEAELAQMIEHTNADLAAGRVLAAAAYIAWRLTWLHPYGEGNGRTSRAAAYAVLCAGDPSLLAAHARRLGAIGSQHLTTPERIERSRIGYLEAVNAAHVEANQGDAGYLRFVNLSRLESYIAGHVARQIEGRPSPEDRVCGCRPCGCRA